MKWLKVAADNLLELLDHYYKLIYVYLTNSYIPAVEYGSVLEVLSFRHFQPVIITSINFFNLWYRRDVMYCCYVRDAKLGMFHEDECEKIIKTCEEIFVTIH